MEALLDLIKEAFIFFGSIGNGFRDYLIVVFNFTGDAWVPFYIAALINTSFYFYFFKMVFCRAIPFTDFFKFYNQTMIIFTLFAYSTNTMSSLETANVGVISFILIIIYVFISIPVSYYIDNLIKDKDNI